MARRDDDEHRLVASARTGDLAAFEVLVRRHGPAVYRVALRLLGNTADAEDAAQEAFVRAWRRLDTFRGDAALTTWLYRIVTNHCLNFRRRRPPTTERLPETAVSPAPGPARTVEARLELDALRRALTRLSPEQAAALVLRELEGCSYAQVADILGTTVPAVKGRLHRARAELYRMMREWA